MRGCSLALLFWLALATAGLAQLSSAPRMGIPLGGRGVDELAARKVLVSNYCRLDFEGARLEEAGWNRFKAYTSLHANPEFNRIVIVTRFNVESPAQPVEELGASYQTLGFYDEGEGYTAMAASDQVVFHLQEQKGDLLVTEVRPAWPHVSARAAVGWMNMRIADLQTNDVERSHLKDAVRQLNKFLPQPRTAAMPVR